MEKFKWRLGSFFNITDSASKEGLAEVDRNLDSITLWRVGQAQGKIYLEGHKSLSDNGLSTFQNVWGESHHIAKFAFLAG
ncbi:MAG: hypothetical protein ABI878_07880 [Acidobacteriota bacterium]